MIVACRTGAFLNVADADLVDGIATQAGDGRRPLQRLRERSRLGEYNRSRRCEQSVSQSVQPRQRSRTTPSQLIRPSALVANEAAIGQGATTLRKRPALSGTINVGVPATPQ